MIKGTDIITCKGAGDNGGGTVNTTDTFKLNLMQTYKRFKIARNYNHWRHIVR